MNKKVSDAVASRGFESALHYAARILPPAPLNTTHVTDQLVHQSTRVGIGGLVLRLCRLPPAFAGSLPSEVEYGAPHHATPPSTGRKSLPTGTPALVNWEKTLYPRTSRTLSHQSPPRVINRFHMGEKRAFSPIRIYCKNVECTWRRFNHSPPFRTEFP